MLLGGLLLKLPFSSADGVSKPFIDCLFTATSATCVTGLSICDTFTGWSYFGQAVILVLIQCGGLGLLTFASAFTLIARKSLVCVICRLLRSIQVEVLQIFLS